MAFENFTTYTETDPNSKVTTTSSRVSWAALISGNLADESFLYKDYGASYFTGNLTFHFTLVHSAASGTGNQVGHWGLSKNPNSWYTEITNSRQMLLLSSKSTGGSDIQLHLVESYGPGLSDYGSTTDLSLTGYLGVPVYITLTLSAATMAFTAYSDAARTVSLGSKSRGWTNPYTSFRYLYGLCSRYREVSTDTHTGYTEYLAFALTTASPTVTTQAVTAITATTATGNGNITSLGSPAATQHGHVWKTSTITTSLNYDQQPNFTENGVPSATGAYTSSLTNLVTNTTYYVRSYVKSSVGTIYGTEVSFTASSGVPSVTTNVPTSVVVTTAVGSGTINGTGGASITAHGFVWDKSDQADPTTVDSGSGFWGTINLGAGAVGDYTGAITGLIAATTYKVRAFASNTSGTAYGSVQNITTRSSGTPILTTEPPTNDAGVTAVGNGTITDIGASTIIAYGHVWSTATINLALTPSAQPDYSDNGALDVSQSIPYTFTSLIDNLTAGTTYYVRAYATNLFGSAYGDEEILDRSVALELRRLISIGKGLKIYFTDDDGNLGVIQGSAR